VPREGRRFAVGEETNGVGIIVNGGNKRMSGEK